MSKSIWTLYAWAKSLNEMNVLKGEMKMCVIIPICLRECEDLLDWKLWLVPTGISTCVARIRYNEMNIEEHGSKDLVAAGFNSKILLSSIELAWSVNSHWAQCKSVSILCIEFNFGELWRANFHHWPAASCLKCVYVSDPKWRKLSWLCSDVETFTVI